MTGISVDPEKYAGDSELLTEVKETIRSLKRQWTKVYRDSLEDKTELKTPYHPESYTTGSKKRDNIRVKLIDLFQKERELKKDILSNAFKKACLLETHITEWAGPENATLRQNKFTVLINQTLDSATIDAILEGTRHCYEVVRISYDSSDSD